MVVDTCRHLNQVGGIDAEARPAVVHPGVVQATLQRAAARPGLRFGPDPSTHNRCTVGGMIGNNACGSRALGYGRTWDNVVALDVVTVAGSGSGWPTAAGAGVLEDLHVRGELALSLRTEFGRFARQVSGYALEHLLPERGLDVSRALVGSEGTLARHLGATVRLVDAPAPRAGRPRLPVDGRGGRRDAGTAPPPAVAVEGLDSRIVGGCDVPAPSCPSCLGARAG